MGYRSDVMAAFYVREAKHLPILKLWLTANFPMSEFSDSIRWFDRGMLLTVRGTKWYDDYESVQAFDAAADKYVDLVNNEVNVDEKAPVFSYEFVRIGENDVDIVCMYEGFDCECLLGVTREITCEV